jgi:hypothetical protein
LAKKVSWPSCASSIFPKEDTVASAFPSIFPFQQYRDLGGCKLHVLKVKSKNSKFKKSTRWGWFGGPKAFAFCLLIFAFIKVAKVILFNRGR